MGVPIPRRRRRDCLPAGHSSRADETTQVTYAFISDKAAGDATGQGVNAFGAPWYVVSPSGMQIG